MCVMGILRLDANCLSILAGMSPGAVAFFTLSFSMDCLTWDTVIDGMDYDWNGGMVILSLEIG